MKLINRTLLAILTLAACLTGGCSKSSTQSSGPAQPVDLGVIELTAGKPLRHDLPGGNVCIITANPIAAPDLEIIVAVEKTGKTIGVKQLVPAPRDQPSKFTIGDIVVILTPHMVE